MMKKNYLYLWLMLPGLLLCSFGRLNAQCNRMLQFDGVDDYVQAISPVSGATPFTIELKFTSNNTTGGLCNSSNLSAFRWLFSWDDNGFGIGDCNGQLALVYAPECLAAPHLCTIYSAVINDGLWHCLSVVNDAAGMDIYLDGIPLATTITANTYDLTGFFRLGNSGTGSLGKSWLGAMDDFRFWNTARSATEILDACSCPANPSDPAIATFFSFDQGVPGANNSSITQLEDVSTGGNHGSFHGFSLGNPLFPPATTSNFLCSAAYPLMPYLSGLNLEIKDFPLLSTSLTEVCSGDPLHFCLLDDAANSPAPSGNVAITWEMNDGSGWAPIADPAFNGYCFTVPAGVVLSNCGAGSQGFADIQYRAKFDISNTNPAYTCAQYSQVASLRVCCPISDASVSVTTDLSGNLLCENDLVNFTVTLLSPDPFVNTLGPDTHISWKYNKLTPLPFDDQLSFTYPMTALAPDACFTAIIVNCSKSRSFTSCLTVDKTPICGDITSLSPTNILIPDVLGDPNLYYICPGNDGVLGMVDPATFLFCNPQWQYSFTPLDPLSWVDMGASNNIQNTNILPSYYWSGQTAIFYRIQGKPLNNPSGCDPDYSNTIEVRLQPATVNDVIVGDLQVCKTDPLTAVPLTVSAPNPDYTYTWFCNGLEVGTGPGFGATQMACYWVEISNGCAGMTVETPKHCLEVCDLIPIISCPKNQDGDICIDLGDTITLDACSSTDNCAGTLTYAWTASNGGPGSVGGANGCMFTHAPDDNGTTYTLTVTNTATGCSKAVTTTIIPCDQL